MKCSHRGRDAGAALVEISKQGYATIMLDENLRGLEPALEADGFTVVLPPAGVIDETLKAKSRGGRS